MAYRDGTESLRARVLELEGKLADARREIARLEGLGEAGAGWGVRLAGGKVRIEAEEELPGELDAAGQELLVGELRRRFGVLGQTTIVGTTLGWSTGGPDGGRFVEVTATPRGGATRLRIVERLGNVAGGLFGGIVGGLGGGGLALVVAPLMILGLPWLAPVGALLWVLAVYAAARALYGRISRKREHEIAGVARALAGAPALEAKRAAPGERLRIDAGAATARGARGSAALEAAAEKAAEEAEREAEQEAGALEAGLRRAR